MTTRQLGAALGVFALSLVALNVGLARNGASAVPRQLLARIDGSSGVRVIAIGNSLMAAGFDEGAFESAAALDPGQSFNAALGSSTPVEHRALFERASERFPDARTLVYGYFDLQLSDPPAVRTADFVDNRAASYYLDPEAAAREYAMSTHDRVEFEIFRRLPMMVERGRVWSRLERVRRRIASFGLPARESNRFGDLLDLRRLEPATPAEFAARSAAMVQQGALLNAPAADIVALAELHRMCMVVVEMPMSTRHRDRFYVLPDWRRYRESLRRELTARGIVYVDAADWIDDSRFADDLHLDAEGAREFSGRLGGELTRLGAVVRGSPIPTAGG